MDIKDQHKQLIEDIRKTYPDYFVKRKVLLSAGDVHKKVSFTDTHHLAIICSRILNMHGASVGDINFYKLFQNYLLDEEKRKEINRIIGW